MFLKLLRDLQYFLCLYNIFRALYAPLIRVKKYQVYNCVLIHSVL